LIKSTERGIAKPLTISSLSDYLYVVAKGVWP
jgi:hypothetical protein